jgi:hypothetical protein
MILYDQILYMYLCSSAIRFLIRCRHLISSDRDSVATDLVISELPYPDSESESDAKVIELTNLDLVFALLNHLCFLCKKNSVADPDPYVLAIKQK